MRLKQNGFIPIVNLPGVGSLLSRTYDVYRALFSQLAGITALIAASGFANLFISGILSALVREQPQFVQSFVSLVNLGILVAFGYLYSYLFAAAAYLVHEYNKRGKIISVKKAFGLARQRFASLYWIAILLALVLYGSSFTGILPILFSIWYYFAVYIVLFEKERGTETLAKSRYLLHGLFMKVFGRYAAAMAIMTTFLLAIYYLSLGIPGGWILALFLSLVVLYFSFPFFIAYGYFQYRDVEAVERSTPFIAFRSERAAAAAWSIFGFILIIIGTLWGLMSQDSQKRISDAFTVESAKFILPLIANTEENLEKLNSLFNKFDTSPAVPSDLNEDELFPDYRLQGGDYPY
ncbi:hypothetical protein HYV71_00650 [Candidatus Uhrbacteria bacterium]|nr:hypothetical protein [Candidatus Uhrbacteria bacterium]